MINYPFHSNAKQSQSHM